jgi:hypothetical protein
MRTNVSWIDVDLRPNGAKKPLMVSMFFLLIVTVCESGGEKHTTNRADNWVFIFQLGHGAPTIEGPEVLARVA